MTAEDIDRLRRIAEDLETAAARLRQELDSDAHPEMLRRGSRATARYCVELADLISLYYPEDDTRKTQ